MSRELEINAFAGIINGFLVTFIGYPLDLTKARLQTGMYKTTLECIKNTIKTEGLLGLYRGSLMPLVSHTTKRSMQYPLAEWMKAKSELNHKSSILNNYVIGLANGITGPIIGTPLQVVKISMQTSSNINGTNNIKFSNSLKCISYIYKSYGLKGFYRGFIPTAIKDTIFGMSFIGNYYTMRDRFGSNHWYNNFINGCTAHCVTWFIFIPVDYVKTNIQKSEIKLSIYDVIKNGYKNHGIKVFWKGVLPACLRTAITTGTAMTGYEFIRNYFLSI
jgi:solute carrier family 25 carnitine/acylcarnitine transporter 20/29